MRNLALLLFGLLAMGCASVKSTAAYYTSYTTQVFPPKPPNATIPILAAAPPQGFTRIGRLAFSTDQGWPFLRKSMIYNAQVNGADAVIVKNVSTSRQLNYMQVPPRTEWIPVSNYYRGRQGRVYGYTNWVPFFQPGYTQQWIAEITAIDADMIVLKK